MARSTFKPQQDSRVKRAELLSSVGAGVLGAGLALLFVDALEPYKLIILILGLIAHAFGMLRKHQLENQESMARVGWAEAAYWLCWLGLAGLVLTIVLRRL